MVKHARNDGEKRRWGHFRWTETKEKLALFFNFMVVTGMCVLGKVNYHMAENITDQKRLDTTRQELKKNAKERQRIRKVKDIMS